MTPIFSYQTGQKAVRLKNEGVLWWFGAPVCCFSSATAPRVKGEGRAASVALEISGILDLWLYSYNHQPSICGQNLIRSYRPRSFHPTTTLARVRGAASNILQFTSKHLLQV
jgi:hypothetical protein